MYDFEMLADFWGRWRSQFVFGWEWAASWKSINELILWLDMILPVEWVFTIGGQQVRLYDYLGPEGVYYDALDAIMPYLQIADYFVDMRLVVLSMSIVMAGWIWMFGLDIWTFFVNWRRRP